MVLIINDLQELAKESLCEKCYPVYLARLEPSIKQMLHEFFFDWQAVEATVKGMCLKHLGAFKKPSEIFLQIDEDKLEEFKEEIDSEIYWKFKKDYRYFPDRLKLLHDNGHIGDKLFELLKKVSVKRNKIHRYKKEITDNERIVYYMANWLVSWAESAMRIQDKHRSTLLTFTEKKAQEFMRFADSL